jgi:hypothetical protein
MSDVSYVCVYTCTDVCMCIHVHRCVHDISVQDVALFYVHVTVHRNKFLYNKTNKCTNFPNIFRLKMNLYMFRAVPVPIIRSPLTVLLTLVYVIRFEFGFRTGPGWKCSSILVLLESCLQTCMTYTIAECTVNKLLMMDRRTVRNMKSFMTK